MDPRFPKWLRFILSKTGFLAVPNLWGALCAIAIFTFLIHTLLPFPLDHFEYRPDLLLTGEYWRLLFFPMSGRFDDPLTLLFYCMIVYWTVRELEAMWGNGPTTFYLLLFYLGSLGGSLLTGLEVDLARMGMELLVITFGTLYPDMEMQIYFVLPVKAKWVAAFSGVMILGSFIKGDIGTRIYLTCAFIPYFLFFGPFLISSIRSKYRQKHNRKKFNDDNMWN